ncbi:hypothetical protein F2Q68_00041005 [Brassica cretica]|uniref:Sugar phosphate transporter domain-containing protein n=1 Tax=Brassica cretica TaxID=69181 RepID=A0A8S9MJT9_BRACR|nr:hypothetical protein F2Q68_00041005 [Brassica cretica]
MSQRPSLPCRLVKDGPSDKVQVHLIMDLMRPKERTLDRSMMGSIGHTPDTPHDPPVDFHDQDVYCINTVYYMAPFATMILGVPAFLLEGNGILDWFEAHPSPWSALIIIFSSGVVAFCLNFSIFYVIHSTTAVTFNVAGNLKVAVAVLVSWMIFRNPISPMNAVGCGITLVGCTFYGYVSHLLSQQQPGTPRTPCTPRNKMELMIPLVNDKVEGKV